ncbi:enoyl-[acyl-carrier-protein] reductase FabI [Rathayibacter rathayi]|uniref:Enoyl-[acyl-carrier-protein] reductase [NADH] n=1 Tax=Rathayibacter rathayi TaxID=33887 RepID=A0ABD6W6R8_RATRA|nr:enoyl-ACP reductase FabI [Rathayibacter rathayi]MWV76030.1 enoyl-ACP reductase FabI [Rathayibacter rathayi NCPPB 2980 = VKM Ac-1601]PPF11957.1 enoyl-[acyl-carrier-protein] reductase FabI [Rathayibacter rathayi]PPF42437.1 enoyl-[acyl-carrier-protein] reductase FabI [Rathayibacter rathayi]PPF74814.1 enoyl-[acyl-carrier-protein] reductase FabI [Rathayibacter rathayi]PPG09279.1 enoyl-[acyl-carrier-protein] reductase FabI [Rathayibacter rathayi]
MKMLDGRTVLVSGIYRESSIAFRVAELALEEGATVIASGWGKRLPITRATVKRLPVSVPVVEFDATVPEHVDGLTEQLRMHTDRVDGVVHCISQSWPTVVGDNFLGAPYTDVSHSLEVSAFSYVSLVKACLPLMTVGGSVVGCTIDGAVAWPLYGWAGVAKAAYESENRYLAHHLGKRGIRANLVAAGPIESLTMQQVEGAEITRDLWKRAPLRWDQRDATPTAKTMVALLSDYLPMTTGEVVHCDGGFHAVGY